MLSLMRALALTLLIVNSSPAYSASFTPIEFLPGGTPSSEGVAVSSDGITVVGRNATASGGEAFLWETGNGIQGLGDLPGGFDDSSANGVSSDGSVVVGCSNSDLGGGAGAIEAFLWAGVGLEGLGDIPGGDESSRASGVSADGAVVVGVGTSLRPGTSDTSGKIEAFRWTAGTGFTGLGLLPNVGLLAESAANDVSADGSVVVGISDSRFGAVSGPVRREAFLWTSAAGMVGLGDLPGALPASAANAVNASGTVVVGESQSDFGVGGFGFEAFRWTAEAGMIGLGDLPGGSLSSEAFGVSADGNRVVGSSSTDASTFVEAFIWEPGTGMRRLADVLTDAGVGSALNGWILTSANDISDDGQIIVGSGLNPLGQTQAFVAELSVPEPGTVLSLGLGVVGLVGLGGRRRKKSRSLE